MNNEQAQQAGTHSLKERLEAMYIDYCAGGHDAKGNNLEENPYAVMIKEIIDYTGDDRRAYCLDRMQREDRNGCHTDELSSAEGMPPATDDSIVSVFGNWLAESTWTEANL